MSQNETGNAIPVRVGDRVMRQPKTFGPNLDLPKDKGFIRCRKAYPGTVTYIHSSGRWYTVTFDIGIKESFFT